MNVRSVLLILLIANFALSGLSQSTSSQPKIEAKRSGSKYTLSLNPEPPPPVKTVGASSEPEWLYFWEFGDGHYSEEKNPSHGFTKTGSLPVKVSLTPAYSQDRPRKFSDNVQVSQSGSPTTRNYPDLGRNAYIRLTSNNNELVMREELQLVIHYSPPPGHASGYIALTFNEKSNARRSFRYLSARRYYGESTVEDIYDVPEVIANSKYQDLIDNQAGDFQSIYAFKYQNKSPGQSYRLFVTLRVETPKLGSEIRLKTFFVPTSGTLPNRGVSDEKSMIILASHDPNRITVAPRVMEFPTGFDSTLKYKIYFQNKGEGKANRVNVRINKSEIMNPKTLVIQQAKIAGEPCAMCETVENPQASCLDTVISEKHIDFVFKNVELSGTKGSDTQDNDQTKGEIQFYLRPKVEMKKKRIKLPEVDAIVTGGQIKFDTEEDTIFTNNIDTQFRRRAFAVKIGYNFSNPLSQLVENANISEDFPNLNMMLSLAYTDNPIHKGLSWESELAYSGYRFARQQEKTFITKDENVINLADTLKTDLALNLYYLDVLGQSRYHFTDYIGLGFGAGFSALLAGTGKLDATLKKPASEDKITQTIKSGLLYAKAEDQELTFESGEKYDPEVRNNPGAYLAMVMFADLGIGRVNKGPMLGFRYGSRFQNGLFDFSFARQNYVQLYFQWKF